MASIMIQHPRRKMRFLCNHFNPPVKCVRGMGGDGSELPRIRRADRIQRLNRQVSFRPWNLLSFAVLLIVGCDGEEFGTVSGNVNYEGKPVPAETKVFFQLPGSGYVAAAKIDEQGSFQLSHQGSPKVRTGDYTVFFGPPESNLSQAEFFELKKKVDAEYRKKGKRPPPSPDWVLPEKYYSASTSTLHESVVSGSNEFELILED